MELEMLLALIVFVGMVGLGLALALFGTFLE